jgi:hypothetical protein
MKNPHDDTQAEELMLDLYLESLEQMSNADVEDELRLLDADPRREPSWRQHLLHSLATDLTSMQGGRKPAFLQLAAKEPSTADPRREIPVILDAGAIQFRHGAGPNFVIVITGEVPNDATTLVFANGPQRYTLMRSEQGWVAHGLTRRALASYRKQHATRPAAELFQIKREHKPE